MKHLRVETEEEEGVLRSGLMRLAYGGTETQRAQEVAHHLLERLRATPVARHGGVVHAEDATYAPPTGDAGKGK